MKYLQQFLIIIFISFVGELCNYLLPLPVPASIYGLVIMLLCLMTGILKTNQVHDASVFLIEIMPVMFIPAGVGLMESWIQLKPVLFPVIFITVISTFLVMGITGRITQAVIRYESKKITGREKEKKKEEE